MSTVIWHDLECGAYTEDLPLWRELAQGAAGAVLDVGAGTGRVAIDLARQGTPVIALDSDPDLLDELRRRAHGLPVQAVCADARDFTLETTVSLAIVPMQTVQLLGGASGRAAFLSCARAAVDAGGLLAIAICDARDATSSDDDLLPVPEMRELDGVLYSSRPFAVVDDGEATAIHRLRETVDQFGARSEATDIVLLERVDAEALEAEGAAAGFTVLPRRAVPETVDYIGSEVVILRG